MTFEEFKKDLENRDPKYKEYSDMFDLVLEEWLLLQQLDYIKKSDLKEWIDKSKFGCNECGGSEEAYNKLVEHFKL